LIYYISAFSINVLIGTKEKFQQMDLESISFKALTD